MGESTRRDFLKVTGAGAAGLAVSSASSYAQIVGANDRVRVGVVGLSGTGRPYRPVARASKRFEVGPVTVRVQSVQVDRGRVSLRDRSQGLDLEFQGVEASARPLDRGIDATLEVARLGLQLPTLREEFTEIRTSGWIHQERASLRSVTTRWTGREVRVSGEKMGSMITGWFDLRGSVMREKLAKMQKKGEPAYIPYPDWTNRNGKQAYVVTMFFPVNDNKSAIGGAVFDPGFLQDRFFPEMMNTRPD